MVQLEAFREDYLDVVMFLPGKGEENR